MRSTLALAFVALVGCSSTNSGTTPSDGGATTDEGGTGQVGFDACADLTQTEAQDIIGYELTPCRKEPVLEAVRHVFESPSSASVAATGSVNVTVEPKGTTFDSQKTLCGASGAACITLSGVGTQAFLNLKFTSVTVEKSGFVYLAQCENPGVLQAAEDAIIQDQLVKEGKKADTSIRGDGWRNASSCSLAVARTIAGKL